MLAKRRDILLNGVSIRRTPLLLPSFSSKVPDVDKVIGATAEVIDGPILVSAYDLYHNLIRPPFDFASIVFLDSGGYEASQDLDLSEIANPDYKPRLWTPEAHAEVLDAWSSTAPTVAISYDHPKERLPFLEQVERARRLPRGGNVLREILVKPETERQTLIQLASVIENVRCLSEFDVVGITEKEIGHSILDRMINIALFRRALSRVGLETPIHVFGSLDTIATPMYFLAGADIFDGLTWLRYAYYDGYTLYKYNFGALDLGIKTKNHVIDGRTWFANYRYLADMELDLSRFLRDQNFESLGRHAELFKRGIEATQEAVGE